MVYKLYFNLKFQFRSKRGHKTFKKKKKRCACKWIPGSRLILLLPQLYLPRFLFVSLKFSTAGIGVSKTCCVRQSSTPCPDQDGPGACWASSQAGFDLAPHLETVWASGPWLLLVHMASDCFCQKESSVFHCSADDPQMLPSFIKLSA